LLIANCELLIYFVNKSAISNRQSAIPGAEAAF